MEGETGAPSRGDAVNRDFNDNFIEKHDSNPND